MIQESYNKDKYSKKQKALTSVVLSMSMLIGLFFLPTLQVKAAEGQPFVFLDVRGIPHATEIKQEAPKSVLKPHKFHGNGSRVGYEDEQFTSRQGIDVSSHQGVIDWAAVKSSGVEFAMIRVGYRGYGKSGSLVLDREFHHNIQGAQANGIDVGVYFFSQAINEAEAMEEAVFVYQALQGYQLQLPVVYDPESVVKAWARTDTVSGEQFTKNTITFCEAMKSVGYETMIYSNMLWEAFQFDMDLLKDYSFWYADYAVLPQTPYAFSMWQYTEAGFVDGITGAVDLDVQILKKEEADGNAVG